MAKEATKEVAVQEEKKVVALATTSGFEEFAGHGFEEVRNEDAAIPFLRILAQLSPQVNKRDGKYVQNAEAGMLYNNVFNKAYSGEEGILVVPCYFAPRYKEWKPRASGGGFVATYTPDEAIPLLKKCVQNDRREQILPNGNLLQDTADWYVLFLHEEGVQRAIISMVSTQLKKSRLWNAAMGALTSKGAKGVYTLPTFANVYRMKTVPESNDKGDWFGWEVSRERELNRSDIDDEDLFQQAMNFHRSVKAGAVVVKHEDAEDLTPTAAAHPDDGVPF
jgi:hypothetical protein